ncbi:MAG: M20/M25/M40 family metallo-hydrolase, partial [Lachnospiraceae bacterium]|nr:M20/M25/M40 family metallo-hydrolase [Lachnospiraceae bacterium]
MLKKADYKNVLRYFTELSRVPRGSGFNDKISDFLVAFAKEHGLRYVQDALKNVVIYKPATPGYENHTGVILQGHMDMVCVTAEGVEHDFESEPLELFVDGDMLGARGTTLGGDDGIAVAYGMALLADDTIAHPALEVVITTDEETGMYGAKGLDASLLSGRFLINADSEDE